MLNGYAAGYYYEQRSYERAKKAYERLENTKELPVVDIIAFNDSDCSVIMERACGTQFFDRQHIDTVAAFLCEYAGKAPAIINNDDYLYLQHGDMKAGNIIWTEDTNYVFIDLDNIGYYPVLYDVLHLCYSLRMSLCEITEGLKANSESIKVMFGVSTFILTGISLIIFFIITLTVIYVSGSFMRIS